MKSIFSTTYDAVGMKFFLPLVKAGRDPHRSTFDGMILEAVSGDRRAETTVRLSDCPGDVGLQRRGLGIYLADFG